MVGVHQNLNGLRDLTTPLSFISFVLFYYLITSCVVSLSWWRNKDVCNKGRMDGSFHLWISMWVAGKTVWSLTNTCHIPERLKDEYRYRTNLRRYISVPVYLLYYLTCILSYTMCALWMCARRRRQDEDFVSRCRSHHAAGGRCCRSEWRSTCSLDADQPPFSRQSHGAPARRRRYRYSSPVPIGRHAWRLRLRKQLDPRKSRDGQTSRMEKEVRTTALRCVRRRRSIWTLTPTTSRLSCWRSAPVRPKFSVSYHWIPLHL